MYPYRLPLRFIGLWVLNIAVLLALTFGLGLDDFFLSTLRMKDLTTLYLILGGILAGLEDLLIDKLKGK